MRGATSITLQPHQMLPLPRKMIRIIHCRDICNVIYNARSNRHHPPTSPNTAPATQKCTPKSKQNSPRTVEAPIPMRGRFDHDPTMIRTWSEHELVISHPPVRRGYFSRFGDAFCIENYNISRSGYLLKFHRILRLPRKVTLQPHQMLLLPRKMMRIIDCRRIWNVIYNAQSNRHRPPTSPNTAPATQNDSHDWSSSHMKRHLQCAEQQALPSNLTKYCACHAKWLSWLIFVTYETSFTMRGATGITLQPHQILRLPRKSALQNLSKILRERLKRQFQCAADSTMIRPWSEHDPTMIRAWTRHLAPARSSRLLFALRRRILYWKLQHFALRLSTQISPNTAPATKSDPPTSPNAAPATKNDAHHWLSSHMKRHLQCAEQQASPSNLTKYCACHAKWLSWLIFVTYETSFTMRRATGITLEPHQILRLPRKMTLMIDLRHIWNVIYNARSNRHHPPTSPNTAPATQKCTPKSKQNSPRTVEAPIPMRGRFDHDPTMIRTWSDHDPSMNSSSRTRPFVEVTFRASETHFVLKITTFRAPAIYSNFTEYCACHEKWPSNLTKCCSCHEKWCASLIVVAYETSFTMRRATGITLQPHQILRLPRKSALQNLSEILRERLKRQFQCAADSTMIRTWSDHDPNMIRPWSEHELVISHPPVRRGYFSRFGDAFCIENYNISRSGYLLKFHRILRLPRKVTLRHHQILRLPRKMTLRHHQMLRLPRKVTLRHHQILRLPRKVRLLLNCYWTELLLSCYWAVTKLLLSCYWTVTELLLNCYWTELLLDCHSTVTELTCYS